MRRIIPKRSGKRDTSSGKWAKTWNLVDPSLLNILQRNYFLKTLKSRIARHFNPTGNVATFLLQQAEIAGPVVVYTLVKRHKENRRSYFGIFRTSLGNRSSNLSKNQCADPQCTEEGQSFELSYDLGNGILGKASYCSLHLAKGKSSNPFKDLI